MDKITPKCSVQSTAEVKKQLNFFFEKNSKCTNNVQTCSVELNRILDSLEVPISESLINQQEVTELENYFHTLQHIWTFKKSSYMSKIAVRQGLKHFGDNNCIIRVHTLLEQIGVINSPFFIRNLTN